MDSLNARLASTELVAPRSKQSRQYLLLLARSEAFAVPIEQVREVIEYQVLTRIPLAPAVVPGVINLRGVVMPVVDLSARLGRPAASVARRTCIVVIEHASDGVQALLGVLVDAVSEAVEVDDEAVRPCPAGAGIAPAFVSGLLTLPDRFVVVLDVATVLRVEELSELVREERLVLAEGEPAASREATP